MSWVAVAIGGSALLGYMGSQNAASAQTSAANQANATQQNQYNQTRQDQMPWMNRGNAAGNQMAYLLGLPGYGQGGSAWGQGSNGGSLGSAMGSGGQPPQMTPEQQSQWASSGYDPSLYQSLMGVTMAEGGSGDMRPQGGSTGDQFSTGMGGYGSLSTPFSQTNWQQDPGYQFRLQEGQKALERSGAAKGMSLSGAQAKALQGYGQGMASQEYGNAYNRYQTDQTNLYNRLAGVAGTGQTAANQIGSLGANMANQVSANQIGAGNANAAGWTAGTGAISNGLNSWGNYNAWLNAKNAGGAPGGTYNGIGTGSGQFDWANGWGGK